MRENRVLSGWSSAWISTTHCAAPPAGQNKLPQYEVNMRRCPVLRIQSLTRRLITLWLQGITGLFTEDFLLLFYFSMCHCLLSKHWDYFHHSLHCAVYIIRLVTLNVLLLSTHSMKRNMCGLDITNRCCAAKHPSNRHSCVSVSSGCPKDF